MIYLDTHAVLWLYAGEIDQFSAEGKRLLDEHDLAICAIVRFELQYLFEIGRATVDANQIIFDLAARIGLEVCPKEFASIIERALLISWTRDPFDRLIVANAALDQSILLSKDWLVRSNYEHAQW